MLKWFCTDKKESNEIKTTEKIKSDNYDVDNKGNIIINAIYGNCYSPNFPISKESIISHTEKSIVFKDYVDTYNHQIKWGHDNFYIDYTQTIEKKEDFIRYKETRIKTFTYYSDIERWNLVGNETVETKVISKTTPLEIFKEQYKSKYKLIEAEDEFNEYLISALDCDTWCRKKLYDKMKELGLGDGFINQFADLVGNDLDKYYAMIDLAGEVADKDTLMYLYTYKFKQN